MNLQAAAPITAETLSQSLRILAEALPSGAPMTVPRDWVLQVTSTAPAALLDGAPAPTRLLTAKEAAVRINVSEQFLYRDKGARNCARKLGRRMLRFDADALDRFAARRTAARSA